MENIEQCIEQFNQAAFRLPHVKSIQPYFLHISSAIAGHDWLISLAVALAIPVTDSLMNEGRAAEYIMTIARKNLILLHLHKLS